MTLEQYVDQLQAHLHGNPNQRNLTVVYASDDEGNSHHPVVYAPGTLMKKINQWNFEDVDELKEATHVCIN